MSDLIVIGICGKARSGKDTVAQHLVNEHGFFRVALADGIRSAFSDLDGPTWELRKELEAAGKTGRWALQTLGTECRQATHNSEIWVDTALAKINYLWMHHVPSRNRFVIPDIRFPGEYDSIDDRVGKWGGQFVFWKVERPDSGLTGDAGKHSSETEIESIKADVTIQNKYSLGDLRSASSGLINRILNARKEPDPT